MSLLVACVVAAGCGSGAGTASDETSAGSGDSSTVGSSARSRFPHAHTRRHLRQRVVAASAGYTMGVGDHVVDGDTIAPTSGVPERVDPIDSPEGYGTRECFCRQGWAGVKQLLPPGTRV